MHPKSKKRITTTMFFDMYALSSMSDNYIETYHKAYVTAKINEIKEIYLDNLHFALSSEIRYIQDNYMPRQVARALSIPLEMSKDLFKGKIEDYEVLAQAFNKLKWMNEYGGTLWADIAMLANRLKFESPDNYRETMCLIDKVNQIEHNTGTLFSKFNTDYKTFDIFSYLSIKFHAPTPYTYLNWCNDTVRKIVSEYLRVNGVMNCPVNRQLVLSPDKIRIYMLHLCNDVINLVDFSYIKDYALNHNSYVFLSYILDILNVPAFLRRGFVMNDEWFELFCRAFLRNTTHPLSTAIMDILYKYRKHTSKMSTAIHYFGLINFFQLAKIMTNVRFEKLLVELSVDKTIGLLLVRDAEHLLENNILTERGIGKIIANIINNRVVIMSALRDKKLNKNIKLLDSWHKLL